MSKKLAGLLSGVGLLAVSVPSFAVIDYSGIEGAVDVTTVATAIVAMAVLKVGPNVASWASRKLAGFFR